MMSPNACWDNALALIRKSVGTQQYNKLFKPLVFESFDESQKILLVQVPSSEIVKELEAAYMDLLSKVSLESFGMYIRLAYRVMANRANSLPQNAQSKSTDTGIKAASRVHANQASAVSEATKPQDIDSQLNPHQTFKNYIEGKCNKLPRSVGQSIAEHPNNNQFNPMFIYGPSGCGKTHLINAIGVHAKQLYPQMRVLYISARLFQVQYTNAVLQNEVNDFINFYQTIDMLIVDDIQEWATATKTQDTFFHIFNHLFRNGKRIILASDRPPVDLKGMNDRLLTRFSCGLIAELEKPNVELCVAILNSKIRRDGLHIPEDVVHFIASTANGSVRDLQGVINSLLAYSVVYNCEVDMKLATRVIKRAVKIDDKPLTVDDIMDTVCTHFNVTTTAVNSKSRKRDLVIARQVSMYLAQKYTKMPASRIGKLVGNRDHSTVIHSCTQVEQKLKYDAAFRSELVSIENSFHLK